MGQSRHFDRAPLTSGLPRLADMSSLSTTAAAGWQGFCDAETKAVGLCQSGALGVRGMKHQRHFGSSSDLGLREVARISALIGDLDRVVRILDSDIATEEERVRVCDPFDPTYPIVARMLRARRDNLMGTIVALEKRLAGRIEQVPT
jgi:hypothetical protein